MRAIQAREAGGPDVLELVELPDPVPGPGQVLVKAAAAGVNFIDTYRRSGVYPMPFPHVVGSEGAGTVVATGPGASTFAVGDRVAWSDAAGSNAVVRYIELADLTSELPQIVRGLTGGAGVHTVFDGVGRTTFDASLACLRRRGGLALFGGSSGPVPPVDPQRLNRAGSVYLTRPTIGDYTATRAELTWRAAELF